MSPLADSPEVQIPSAHTWECDCTLADSAEEQNQDDLASYQPQEDTRYLWQYKNASYPSKEQSGKKKSTPDLCSASCGCCSIFVPVIGVLKPDLLHC